MRPVFDNVLLVCPEVATGGPEAMHQLAGQINQQGGHAVMAYSGPYSQLSVSNDIIRGNGDTSPMLKHFAQYHPQALREVHCGPQTLFIYPEIAIDLATGPRIANARHALWWLSVDNALLKNPRLLDEAYRRSLFADPELIHFYQSEYAHAFLKNAGVAQCHPLSDYTDPQFIQRSLNTSDNPPIIRRPENVCFFPTKGAALAKQFITQGTLRHRIELVPIHGMTKAQVQKTLFNAKLYIDFGHHPGKDRVPREAAIAGAIVLVHAAGAANYYGDYPLTAEYRFTTEDVASGQLHSRIDTILDDPEKHFNAQSDYRQTIIQERKRFDSEICSFFFAGM